MSSVSGSLVAIVARDLIIATLIGELTRAVGHHSVRVDTPSDLPPAGSVLVAFVDWSARDPNWADTLHTWCAVVPEPAKPRVVLFGSHTDLAAHADARAAGFGPMLARSKLVTSVGVLVSSSRLGESTQRDR